jgi:hypothetical protein
MKRFAEFLSRNKRHLATAALLVGFAVDVVTFRNLNLDLTQIILVVHLTIVAGSILVLQSPLFSRFETWILVANQYSTGNLLSAFLILYSASGSLAASWPFFVLVLASAIGNEVLRLEKYRLPFQTSLFFLNLVLFMALAVPILLGSIGAAQFFASVWAALALFVAFVWVGRLVAPRAFLESAGRIRAGWITVFVLMFVLYFTNLIPPIPLSLKSAGFYHSVSQGESAFSAEDEQHPWYERFLTLGGERLRLAEGEPAYFYGAVFAPAKVDTTIVHRWEQYDPRARSWDQRHTVKFSIEGGRHGGYRGYSLAESLPPGKYRVSVETARGQVIGRTYLTVLRVSSPASTYRITLE